MVRRVSNCCTLFTYLIRQLKRLTGVISFLSQKYPEHAVYKVLQLMIRREEIQHRMQRKMLYRVK